MKDYLFTLIQDTNPHDARNRMREYLQARILGTIQRSGSMIPLAFHGGTALRFLYGLERYSEDLDFALERADKGYDFFKLLRMVRSDMEPEGYQISIKANTRRTVQSAFIRFENLLFEAGLSPLPQEKISVKIKVDTLPPKGAVLETTLIRKFVTLQIQHHDRASLLAGKCNAILTRSYLKGRDIYDLFWYLSDKNWPPPNLVLLNNALAQFGWQKEPLDEFSWRSALQKKLKDCKWKTILSDVEPFLDPHEMNLFTPENLSKLLVQD